MSGVCGAASFSGAPVPPELLESMAEAAHHRGPDGVGYWLGDGVGLVNLLLATTPEALRERQPLSSLGGDVVLTADARVDNRSELVRALRPGGYLRESDPTDADLILAAYLRWGEDCPARLVGDFAFVVWDARLGRVFAAVDPMGMRSLYYFRGSKRLLLATEVKQLLAVPGVPARIFEPAVAAHLSAADVPPEWTFYEGISRLSPGHALIASAGGCRTRKYWDADPDNRIRYASEEEYAEHFRELFKEAVRCRLRGTKPAGLLLSGGIDSGNIAATAGWILKSENGGYPGLRAYSWAFDRLAQCDERYVSDGIAAHYGIPVTSVPAEAAWPLKDYPERGPDLDDPYTSGFQTLIEHGLDMAGAEGVGTMLTGHRGDLVAGMWIFDYLGLLSEGRLLRLGRELRAHERLTRVPVRQAAGIYLLDPLKRWLWPRERAEWLRRPVSRSVRRLRGDPPPEPPHPPWVREDFARRYEPAAAEKPGSKPSEFARDERCRAIFTPLHQRAVGYSERLMSRHGLSHADPWSDRRLIEFALAVPQREINRAGENKRIARRSMAGIMPERPRLAAGKVSPEPLFHSALKDWSRGTVLELISGSQAAERGYVDERALAGHYEDFREGRVNDPRLWYTLTLEMWLRRHWS